MQGGNVMILFPGSKKFAWNPVGSNEYFTHTVQKCQVSGSLTHFENECMAFFYCSNIETIETIFNMKYWQLFC